MEDTKTVHYVTQDPMSNLKLKVTLTRLSAAKSKQRDQGLDAGSAASDNAAASSSSHDAAAGGRSDVRPAPFQVVRIFTWQEKFYSKAELVAAQAYLRANQQQGAQFMSPKRIAHFGSQSHIGTDRLLTASPEGCLLFSYVQTDDFCERFETSRSITTSRSEGQNHLANKLLMDARNRQKMLNFHAMFIMADLGDEHTVAGSNEKVLCVIRAHRDGSFDMAPGFNAPGHKTRFEDDHGGIYEYTIEPASQGAAPCLEKRAAKLASAVAAQAEEFRSQSNRMDHTPPPGPDGGALRLVLMAELVSAAGFQRDRLYIEWQLKFDPELWVLQHSEQEVVQPGLIQGVTHVSQMAQYPADVSTDTPALWVAHFAHPIEVEWIAKTAPALKDWPRLLLQVCTYDLWDRISTEGYGWLQLGGICPGSNTHYVDTWKPLGTRRDQQQAWFIGGTEELEDMSYAAVPKGHKGRVLNKYGYKTQTSGSVKVRVHSVVQTGSSGGNSPRKTAANKWPGSRQHREISLAVVLERAHARLREARGGDIAIRPGVVSQRPVVTVNPADVAVNQGGTAQFSVVATGLPPLRYRWYKDSKSLTVATSDTPLLILVDVGVSDSGTYCCQVSNKDGAVSSSKALLSITRIGHLQRATGVSKIAAGSDMDSSSGEAVSASSPSLSNTFSKRTTIPRSLARGGGGLPYSPRFSSRSVSGSPAPSGTASPLRASLANLSSTAGRAGAGARSSAAATAGDDSSSGGLGGGSPMRQIAAVGSWASASTGSPLRRSTQLAALSPGQQQQQQTPQTVHHSQEQQQQQVVDGQRDLQHHLPPSGFRWGTAGTAAAAAAAVQQLHQEASVGEQAASAAVSTESSAADAANASPVRPVGASRRARVSEQQ